MKADTSEGRTDYIKWANDVPETVEEYFKIKDTVTKECCWYIIGKYCEREKCSSENNESNKELLIRLGQKFGCSEPTIRRFVSYGKAIDYLQSVAPDIVADILSGELKISIENVRSLNKMPYIEMHETVKRIKSGKDKIHEIFPERARKQQKASPNRLRVNSLKASVKDTPKYNPDAQVMGLTYTIPSWVAALERIFMNNRFCHVTKSARKKLVKELTALKNSTELLLEILPEENYGECGT